MTATYSRTFIRTSTDTPFPPEPVELAEYISIIYAGKCITWRETSVSEDGLVKICKSTWINLIELELAKEDGILIDWEKTMTQYCQNNEIVSFASIE